MRRTIKLLVSCAVFGYDRCASMLSRLLGRRGPGVLIVLYYHEVTSAQRPGFSAQMDVLLAHAAPVGAMECPMGTNGGPYCAVTFDDGFISVIENALPEMRARGIPATIFVPPGSLGCRPTWIQDRAHPAYSQRVVDASELRAAARWPLLTVGSHTVDHVNLTRVDRSEAERQLRESKEMLERILEKPVSCFSYPHGAWDSELIELARDAGYERVFTIDPEGSHCGQVGFKCGRVSVSPDDSSLEFRLKIENAYRWMGWLSLVKAAAGKWNRNSAARKELEVQPAAETEIDAARGH